MAKEAGKTGNPPPPIVRPPMLGGPMGQNASEKFGPMPPLGSGHPPMPNLRQPTGLMNINLPPLEPLPLGLRDDLPNLPPPPQLVMEGGREKERQRILEGERDKERRDSSLGSRAGEQKGRESSRHNSNTVNQPDINELEEGEREIIRINDDSTGEDDDEDCKVSASQNSKQKRRTDERMPGGEKEGPSNGGEDLQRLQSMIMELNSNKSKAAQVAAQLAVAEMGGLNSSSTICRVCNKDMENKYFLRAHMMNEHGVLHMEDNHQISARSEAEAMR